MQQKTRNSETTYSREHAILVTDKFGDILHACSDEEHGNSCVCKYLSTSTEDPIPTTTTVSVEQVENNLLVNAEHNSHERPKTQKKYSHR